jgi:caffeoyl-CoA O-methyltransferase
MKFNKLKASIILFIFLFCCSNVRLVSQELLENKELDKKVIAFLTSQKGQWYDMNVPESDGKLLYDLIIKNKYKNAIEIGTSTGHSAIWMAWALSKTGGKLITIEIDKGRYNTALANFKKAGLLDYIDARLADAHELVPKLNGPVDFVFCDADKDWYNNYFNAIDKVIVSGGCYTAHNIPMKSWSKGIRDFLENIKNKPNYSTTIDNSGGGLSISYKK